MSARKPLPYGRLMAALSCAILLFVPIVLAGAPALSKSAVPGPYTRPDAVLAFFAAVPIVFTLFVVYKVAKYRGWIETGADRL